MSFAWQEVDWVLLDMDGTLLDKHFDDYFWETLVPRNMPAAAAWDWPKPVRNCLPGISGKRGP